MKVPKQVWFIGLCFVILAVLIICSCGEEYVGYAPDAYRGSLEFAVSNGPTDLVFDCTIHEVVAE